MQLGRFTSCFAGFALLLWALASLGCAYRFGFSERRLPGGYDQVAIPVFKNKTAEVGIEIPFTNALVREFARSRVAKVADKATSPVTLEGAITAIEYVHGAGVAGGTKNSEVPNLPNDAVLTTEYRILMKAQITLRRNSDQSVIWSGFFQGEKVYSAPRIGTAVVNSANALYNQSARQDTIARIADEMMNEAHDHMTENF